MDQLFWLLQLLWPGACLAPFSSFTILAIIVMGGLTEEEEEEEDQELQEQEAEEEAEATLCWDSRVTSMNSRLTLFVAMVD